MTKMTAYRFLLAFKRNLRLANIVCGECKCEKLHHNHLSSPQNKKIAFIIYYTGLKKKKASFRNKLAIILQRLFKVLINDFLICFFFGIMWYTFTKKES